MAEISTYLNIYFYVTNVNTWKQPIIFGMSLSKAMLLKSDLCPSKGTSNGGFNTERPPCFGGGLYGVTL